MAKGRTGRVRAAAVILLVVGAVLAGVPVQAEAQVAVGGSAESPSDSLARNMKVLGTSPRSFDALIGAGRAALALGDTQAAAGFFGRADEVWPESPLPQAGMGAALAQEGDGSGALQFFGTAVRRGATQSMIGADRGLAYDLVGQHSQAQSDYRAALSGRDGDEARRRLALSLAVSGNKAEALSLLSPLMARGDAAGARTRAFVLALTGDAPGARSAIEAAMPGSSRNMDYFFRKLPSLRSEQKVAAVNLGIFPDSGVQVASVSSPPPVSMNAVRVIQRNATRSDEVDQDRIGSIERWLSQATQGNASLQPPPAAPPPQQLASATVPTVAARQELRSSGTTYASRKLWIQLASGPNAAALPEQFSRMKKRNNNLFEGVGGYVFEEPGRARLLIGPFRNNDEANIFAEDLASVHIDAFTWTSQAGQTIRKLPSE
ncbi:MAG: tetratricopeptide repeat protein [Sphingomonas sp.]|nr:tetratricopeptide repeat protein [Sphingomonas sp.]